MPSVEIGPFEIPLGEGDNARLTKLLRLGSFISTHVELPPEVTDKGQLITHLAELLQTHERRLTLLLMALREGSVGFEETDGLVTKLTFSYPELGETKGKPS